MPDDSRHLPSQFTSLVQETRLLLPRSSGPVPSRCQDYKLHNFVILSIRQMNFSPPGRAVLFPRPRGDRRRRGVPSRFVPAAVLGGARLSVCGPSERACVCVFRCWACRSAGTCLRRSRGAAASARLPSASCSRASASSRCSPSPSSRSSRCSTSCTAWQSCSSLRRLCGYVCRAPASSARSSAPRPQGLPLPLPRFRCKGHSRNKSCFVPVFRGVHALTNHDPTHPPLPRTTAMLVPASRPGHQTVQDLLYGLCSGYRPPPTGCSWLWLAPVL